MGFGGRSTIGVLAVAAALSMHARAITAPLAASDPIPATLSCLQPVDGLTWMRWDDNRQALDLWCHSVGRPVLQPRFPAPGDITGMRILSWNVHVGGGRLEELLPRLLDDAARADMGLTILLQETFRTGDAVPESYPATLRVPRAVRPRRPTMDVRDIAEKFGLSVAYVPSMRNGPATSLTEREDRGNAILSTEPLIDARAIELPFGKQRRVAVTALIPPRGGDRARSIRVVSTHFDTNGDRVAQAAALSERLTFLTDVPLFVGGDLNSMHGMQDNAVLALASRFPLASCGYGPDQPVAAEARRTDPPRPPRSHVCRDGAQRYRAQLRNVATRLRLGSSPAAADVAVLTEGLRNQESGFMAEPVPGISR